MDVPISRIDIEYLVDAAEKTSKDKDINKYIPYILFKDAQEKLKEQGSIELEPRIRKGLSCLADEGINIQENVSIIQVLVQFYLEYKEKNKIDELREEDKLHKWGVQVTEDSSEIKMREDILTTSKALRTALKMLTLVERGDTSEEDFIRENGIPEEFLQDTDYDKEGSYNIIPFDGCTNWLPAEVEHAINELKLAGAALFPTGEGDVLDHLEKIFKFQEDNVSNQRENIVNLLSNELMRLGEHERALDKVFLKTFDNYEKWCLYLSEKPIWKRKRKSTNDGKKILYISLYYLIWGEAANVRFLPECLCYIFHRMSEQLDKYLRPASQQSDDQDVVQVPQPYEGSFIDEVIQPLYDVIAAEANFKKFRNLPHSKSRNYDDFNEHFWSLRCIEQFGWPINVSNLQGKPSFIERRTFWHLYHSFHRMWIFHVMMFQALVIFAFNDGKLNTKTLREILRVGPTYFLMNLIQSMLDIVLKYGAYSNKSRRDVFRFLFRFIWFMLATLFICFLCMKCLQEKTSSVDEPIVFIVYIAVLVILFSTSSKRCENSFIAHLIKWINQNLYLEEYVGRGMDEELTDYIKYMLFWLVTLGINFAFTYYLLIRPLVRPTRDITDVSKDIHNMLAIGSLWVGVICAYIVGSHISYNVISAFVGTFVGHTERLGNIKFLGDVHKCFDQIPTAFMNHNRESHTEEDVKKKSKLDAAEFLPFWNEIVRNLREEDYISNSEQYALSMPEKSGRIDVIQWPLFLLAGKVSLAIKIAAKRISREDMWDEISRDVYMRYAVEEFFHSVMFILSSVLNGGGEKWVIADDGNLGSEFQLNQLKSFVEGISELTGILNARLNNAILQGNAIIVLKRVIQHDFLGEKKIAVEKISDFNWPTDRKLRSQIERLHLLLTKDKSDYVPRNRDARRRLEFFTNSLFMSMPTAASPHNVIF